MKKHWPFAMVAVIALALLLTNLGSDYLWADEGDTAVLASNILKFGVPKAWDGVTFIDSDRGARVNTNLVMVSHPWLQYYLTAAAFLVFGQNTFAARLPFALAGWLTLILIYSLVWRVTENRPAAFMAASLTLLSVQFLLYARQCRNYSVHIFLTCAAIAIFLQMKSGRMCAFFVGVAILLFHTHPIGIIPTGVLGLATLASRRFAAQRRWFWLGAPVIAVFTLIWLPLAKQGYTESTQLVPGVSQFANRFAQYSIECASVAPVIGLILLFVFWLLHALYRKKSAAKRSVSASERNTDSWRDDEARLLIIIIAILLAYGLAMAATQSIFTLWHIGIRQTPAVIPLVAVGVAILIFNISRGKPSAWIPIWLLVAFTAAGEARFWIASGADPGPLNRNEIVAAHAPTMNFDRFFQREQWFFLRDLFDSNPGTVAACCQVLHEHAKPEDRLIANYDWEPLYFHTRLPQALKIFPDYPVFKAAQDRQLPDYVFKVDHARWIVWRPFWDGYQGYHAAEVEQEILLRGGRLTEVAELEESVWENRENLHFHRFSGGTYLFPWFNNPPKARIFRVDWPE